MRLYSEIYACNFRHSVKVTIFTEYYIKRFYELFPTVWNIFTPLGVHLEALKYNLMRINSYLSTKAFRHLHVASCMQSLNPDNNLLTINKKENDHG